MIGHFLDKLKLREYASRLAIYAVNGDKGRVSGDPVHEEVTEGRTKQWEDARRAGSEWAKKMIYSSCGDLAYWMLWRLGCRDEKLLNRTNDGGVKAWVPGRNTTNITGYSKFIRGGVKTPYQPGLGDILFTMHAGGHIAIVLEWCPSDEEDGTGYVLTADYGQPYGSKRKRKLTQRKGLWYVQGDRDPAPSHVLGWINIEDLEYEAMPDLPDAA